MSKAWAGGSTRAWRRTRAQVLVRDGYRCQIRLPGCTQSADQVHHVAGKRAGDDPALLVAACRLCNNRLGDPNKRTRPTPKRITQW